MFSSLPSSVCETIRRISIIFQQNNIIIELENDRVELDNINLLKEKIDSYKNTNTFITDLLLSNIRGIRKDIIKLI